MVMPEFIETNVISILESQIKFIYLCYFSPCASQEPHVNESLLY